MTCEIASNNQHFKTIGRVNSYPIVADSVDTILSYYRWLKSTNSTIDSTLTKAETVLQSVKDKTEPFAVEKLQFMDSICVNQLEKFEKICPIVKEPSEKFYQIPSNMYQNQVIPAFQTVIINPVSKATQMTMGVVENTVDRVVPSFVVDKTEYMLDQYVFGSQKKKENGDEDTNCETNSKKIKRMSVRGRKQLYRKAAKELEILYEVSVQKLEAIKELLKEAQKLSDEAKSKVLSQYETSLAAMKASDLNPLPMIMTLEKSSYRLLTQTNSMVRHWQQQAENTRNSLMKIISHTIAKSLLDPMMHTMESIQSTINTESESSEQNDDTEKKSVTQQQKVMQIAIQQTGHLVDLMIKVTVTLRSVLENFYQKDQELDEIKEDTSESSSTENESRII